MANKLLHEKAKIRPLGPEEVGAVSGGLPIVVKAAAIYGGYQFGKAVGKGARRLQNAVKEKLAQSDRKGGGGGR